MIITRDEKCLRKDEDCFPEKRSPNYMIRKSEQETTAARIGAQYGRLQYGSWQSPDPGGVVRTLWTATGPPAQGSIKPGVTPIPHHHGAAHTNNSFQRTDPLIRQSETEGALIVKIIPPPWSAPNGVLPQLNEEKGIWWEQILSLLRRLPLIPTLDHDLPTPSHSSLELNLLFDDLCKLLHRSSVPRIIHYTSSASTDLIFVQKNYATADIEAKKVRQKACKSRHLLICNKSA